MIAHKCDRCGRCYTEKQPQICLADGGRYLGEHWLDLCPECYEAAKRFMEGGSQEGLDPTYWVLDKIQEKNRVYSCGGCCAKVTVAGTAAPTAKFCPECGRRMKNAEVRTNEQRMDT